MTQETHSEVSKQHRVETHIMSEKLARLHTESVRLLVTFPRTCTYLVKAFVLTRMTQQFTPTKVQIPLWWSGRASVFFFGFFLTRVQTHLALQTDHKAFPCDNTFTNANFFVT